MNFRSLISLPYQIVHALRCSLYDLKILQRKKLPAYVISIGNLSFGGTGKTPITIALAKYLNDQGLKVAVLTRGYKGKANEYPIIINKDVIARSAATKQSQFNVERIGDEATEMLNEFTDTDITLVVDPNRYRGGTTAYKEHNIDVFILDDGLQHIQLERDLEIILKNVNESGFYREFPSNESKADLLIHTKVTDEWIRNNPEKLYAKFNLSLTKTLHASSRIGVFTAIADPNTLVNDIQEYLRAQGHSEKELQHLKRMFYADHHSFSLGEVKEVLALGINTICTRKDLVKIPQEYKDQFIEARIGVKFGPTDIQSTVHKGVVL